MILKNGTFQWDGLSSRKDGPELIAWGYEQYVLDFGTHETYIHIFCNGETTVESQREKIK